MREGLVQCSDLDVVLKAVAQQIRSNVDRGAFECTVRGRVDDVGQCAHVSVETRRHRNFEIPVGDGPAG